MLKSSYKGVSTEAGCDEAGRGCLAGPVYAAAVMLPSDYKNKELNDSKKLSEKKREILRRQIEEDAVCFGVAYSSAEEIDQHNILKASIFTMHKAIQLLKLQPQLLLIDGNRFIPFMNIPYVCIIKGDGLYMSIAAASILAKTYRDEYMEEINHLYPEYKWDRNKGYPTGEHRKAVLNFGKCSFHRKTFHINEQLKLEL
jgi:ribonuclease HII